MGGEHIIGSSGDFITAPEVSQLFGESHLVWLMTQYQRLNSPPKIQIIEIGPGKGTLMCDMVRSAITTFPDFASALTADGASGGGGEGRGDARGKKVAVGVHLVEVMDGMRERQKESIRNLEREDVTSGKGYSFVFADAENEEKEEEERLPLPDELAVDEQGNTISSPGTMYFPPSRPTMPPPEIPSRPLSYAKSSWMPCRSTASRK